MPWGMEIGRWARACRWERKIRRTTTAASPSISFVSGGISFHTDDRLIAQFTDDVVTTAINSLTTISKTARRPPFSSVFLLNNISYLRQHLLIQQDDAIFALLSPQTSDALNSAYRTAKAGYFDLNFSPLMQAITEDPKDKSNKAAAKEKFTRFFDLFDELVERHKFAPVLDEDAKGRVDVAEEIVMLVVPAFQRFAQKQKDKEFSKSASSFVFLSYLHIDLTRTRIRSAEVYVPAPLTYVGDCLIFIMFIDIKRTPDDVESELRSLFR